jgi:hypothetical protein
VQVLLFRATIRVGHEPETRRWATSLKDRAETGDALKAEGIDVESVFLEERDSRTYLWVYQRVADPRRANEVFLASTNPVDVETRELMAKAWEKVDFFAPVLDYSAASGVER